MRTRLKTGYMLVETIAAMALLSVGIVTINRALHQAVLMRALAKDYTNAAFLMDEVMSYYELQPELSEGDASGRFGAEHPRFSWQANIALIPWNMPAPPSSLPENVINLLNQQQRAYARVQVTITWTRSGRTYQRSTATVIPSSKLWVPPQIPGIPGGNASG